MQVVEAQPAESVLVQVEGADGVVGSFLDGFKSRVLRAGAAEPRMRHLYTTAWEQLVDEAADLPAIEVLLISSAVDVPSQKNGTINTARMPQSAALVMAPGDMVGGHTLLVAEAVLLLLCAVVQAIVAPVAWLLTVRAQPMLNFTMKADPTAAGPWGLGRSARMEVPLSRIGCIDVASAQACEWQPAAWRRMLVHVISGATAEPEHSCTTAHTHVPRLTVAPPSSPSSLRLHLHARGAISNLIVEPLPASIESCDLIVDEARLLVHAVSLNFRDVLNVLGEYPGDPGPPGGDCAGVVAATGDGVAHLCAGDLAFGLAHAPLASAALSHALLLSRRVRSLSFEQACTLPIVWSTVHVALGRSRLCAERRLLVHAAVGGVGIAAIEAARWLHAAVDASASRPYKHAQLRLGLGIGSSCSSRNAGALGWGASWLQRGCRLHCALNSLSLDFISGSLALLGGGDGFCEIGKRSVWSEPRQRGSVGSASVCHTIALDADMADYPQWMQGVLVLLSRRAASDIAHGLPLQVFDLAQGFETAFHVLLGGTITGKVVLRVNRAASSSVCRSGDTQLLTGGTGGLGLLTARWLAQQGAHGVVLASRTGVLPVGGDGSFAAECVQLQASAAWVLTERCDAAEASETCRLLSSAWHTLSAAVGGVWHAAGVLADGTLAHQGALSLRRAFGPKAHGAMTLQRTCATSMLRVCALFSSMIALLGGAGQANYAAANCCLDSHAVWRHAGGMAGVSMQWGAWAEVGMAAGEAVHARLQASGFDLIGLAEGLAALQVATVNQQGSALAVVPARWGVVLGGTGIVPAFLMSVAPQRSLCASGEGVAISSVPGVGLESVLSMVRRTAGGTVDADAPLMDAGVDSLGAVELRNQLQAAMGDDRLLPSTLVFDHPTVRQLASLLTPSEAPTIAGAHQHQAVCGGALVVVAMDGLSALLPAGSGSGSAWHLSACATDAIGGVPPSRWSTVELPEGAPSALRHGGFVYGADLVDNGRYGISPAETAAMDPQQRLLLESGYEALHTAWLGRASLGGSLTGVFVAIAANEFAQLLATSPAGASVYAATGSAHSIASGRLSFVLGLHGACAAYDSACSAALVALHAAVRGLQGDECTRGLAAGVNLMLTPTVGTSFALAGMTSPSGRSYTFDARADGYVRAEACAAVSMAPNAAGDTEGWKSSAVVQGCAVRSDGRSASLTAPNGKAQQGLLRAALADAAAAAESVAAVEAHGTGTALGDPIEAGSLAGALLSDRLALCAPMAAGSLKANIGHAEPAAGLTGLVLLTIVRGQCGAPPNAQLRALNPHLNSIMIRGGCVMPTQLAAMCASGLEFEIEQSVGGVSSFGYSGTIVHAVLLSHSTTTTPHLTDRSAGNDFFHRCSFHWSDTSHPLLQQSVPDSDDLAVFRSPTAGRLHALVSEHVVQGRVVFPGAAYLETARAAWAASTSLTVVGASLNGVFFLQPLALDAEAHGTKVFVECMLRKGGLFEVRSGDVAVMQGHDAPSHCTGTALASTAPPQHLSSIATKRSGCVPAGCVGAQYEAFHAVGLQYGPSYRRLQQAWTCEQERRGDGLQGAAARLQHRPDLREVAVHPADLDGALQLNAMLQPAGGKDAGETWLPFAMESALLEGGAAEQWAVRTQAPT